MYILYIKVCLFISIFHWLHVYFFSSIFIYILYNHISFTNIHNPATEVPKRADHPLHEVCWRWPIGFWQAESDDAEEIRSLNRRWWSHGIWEELRGMDHNPMTSCWDLLRFDIWDSINDCIWNIWKFLKQLLMRVAHTFAKTHPDIILPDQHHGIVESLARRRCRSWTAPGNIRIVYDMYDTRVITCHQVQ